MATLQLNSPNLPMPPMALQKNGAPTTTNPTLQIQPRPKTTKIVSLPPNTPVPCSIPRTISEETDARLEAVRVKRVAPSPKVPYNEIATAIETLSEAFAGKVAPKPSRSLADEYKRLNKKHGKKIFQKPCAGPGSCNNVLCDHKYAPRGATTGTAVVPDPRVLDLVMDKLDKEDFPVSKEFATKFLVKYENKLLPTIRHIKENIIFREARLHNSGRISIPFERVAYYQMLEMYNSIKNAPKMWSANTRETILQSLELEDTALLSDEPDAWKMLFSLKHAGYNGKKEGEEHAKQMHAGEKKYREERAKAWFAFQKDNKFSEKNKTPKQIEEDMQKWEDEHSAPGTFGRIAGGVGSSYRRAFITPEGDPIVRDSDGLTLYDQDLDVDACFDSAFEALEAMPTTAHKNTSVRQVKGETEAVKDKDEQTEPKAPPSPSQDAPAVPQISVTSTFSRRKFPPDFFDMKEVPADADGQADIVYQSSRARIPLMPLNAIYNARALAKAYFNHRCAPLAYTKTMAVPSVETDRDSSSIEVPPSRSSLDVNVGDAVDERLQEGDRPFETMESGYAQRLKEWEDEKKEEAIKLDKLAPVREPVKQFEKAHAQSCGAKKVTVTTPSVNGPQHRKSPLHATLEDVSEEERNDVNVADGPPELKQPTKTKPDVEQECRIQTSTTLSGENTLNSIIARYQEETHVASGPGDDAFIAPEGELQVEDFDSIFPILERDKLLQKFYGLMVPWLGFANLKEPSEEDVSFVMSWGVRIRALANILIVVCGGSASLAAFLYKECIFVKVYATFLQHRKKPYRHRDLEHFAVDIEILDWASRFLEKSLAKKEEMSFRPDKFDSEYIRHVTESLARRCQIIPPPSAENGMEPEDDLVHKARSLGIELVLEG